MVQSQVPEWYKSWKEKEKPTQQVPVPLEHSSPGFGPFFAALLSLAATIFLIVTIVVAIPVTGYSVVLSNTGRTLYTTGTTILAGLISAFIAGHIKELWLLDILFVEDVSKYSDHDQPTDRSPYQGTEGDEVDRQLTQRSATRARVTLGIGHLKDRASYWSLTTSFLIIGLITTGIVSGLAPEVYSTSISGQDRSHPPSNLFQGATANLSAPGNRDILTWQWKNDTVIAYNISHVPGGDYLATLTGSFDPSRGISYTVENIPVLPGAVGLPTVVDEVFLVANPELKNTAWDSNEDFNQRTDPTGIYGPGQFVQSEACVPLLTQNPASCHAHYETSDNLTASVSADGCHSEMVINETRFRTMDSEWVGIATGLCTNSSKPGQVIYFFRELYEEPRGDCGGLLAFGMQNLGTTPLEAFLCPALESPSYLVTCTIDMAPTIVWRSARLQYLGQLNGLSSQLQNNLLKYRSNSSDLWTGISQYVFTGDNVPCSPVTAKGPTSALVGKNQESLSAFAVALAWQAIRDRNVHASMLNSYVSAIYMGEKNKRVPPGIFATSTTPLEELLGVLHGAAMSAQWAIGRATFNSTSPANMTQILDEVSAAVFPAADISSTSMRIGPGQWWAIVYAAPSLYAFIVLTWLLYRRLTFAVRKYQATSEETTSSSLLEHHDEHERTTLNSR